MLFSKIWLYRVIWLWIRLDYQPNVEYWSSTKNQQRSIKKDLKKNLCKKDWPSFKYNSSVMRSWCATWDATNWVVQGHVERKYVQETQCEQVTRRGQECGTFGIAHGSVVMYLPIQNSLDAEFVWKKTYVYTCDKKSYQNKIKQVSCNTTHLLRKRTATPKAWKQSWCPFHHFHSIAPAWTMDSSGSSHASYAPCVVVADRQGRHQTWYEESEKKTVGKCWWY